MSVHLIFEFLTAFVGTIAFALLFQVPKEYYVNCGLAGGCGWICYKLLLAGCGLFGSTFFATVLVVFLSRLSAVRRLLCRDRSAGQSFRPWIPDFEDRGGDRAWHPVCL